MQKYFFFALLAVLAIAPLSAYADIEKGKDYDREIIATGQDGITYRWTSHPERILDGNVYRDYRLFQDSNIVQLETANSGSLVFDKNTCAYNLYGNGYINDTNTPKIKGISWTVKGKLSSAVSWSNVNSVNNAACSVAVTTTEETVKITGTKANGLGTFQIVLDYFPGRGIKETMRAYNNNPAWNNHNIGFTETFEVPQLIHLGGKLYDLSQLNGTILGRNWIGNNTEKLISLSNKINYNFGLGWSNLNDTKIIWDGTKAKLALNYLYPVGIVPYQQWISVDPTFTTNNPTVDGHIRTTDVAGAACGAVLDNVNNTSTVQVSLRTSAGGTPSCARGYFEWPTTSISPGVTVTDVDIAYAVSSDSSARTCNWNSMSVRPSTSGSTAIWNAIGSGTTYVAGDTTCQTTGNNKALDLGNTANTNLQALLPSGYFPLGVTPSTTVRDATDRFTFIAAEEDAGATPKPTLTVVYLAAPPSPITTLAATSYTAESVDLGWSAPNLNGGTLQLYQLNYTTPCSNDPTTHLPNGTTATSYTISGLTAATCYSFRATAATEAGRNTVGANVVNVTTLAFNQANFTIGTLSFDADNPLLQGIRFTRTDNGSASRVNVTYSNTINLACDLRYEYSMTNHTYHTISHIAPSTTEFMGSFLFQNSTNDIVTIHCWDQSGNQTATYILTQTEWLLKQQVQDFRNGTYGTHGMMGALDLITLIVVIIAMIGFNRTNEAVGGVFCLAGIGALAYFEIITWQGTIFSALAVILMIIIASTRKD